MEPRTITISVLALTRDDYNGIEPEFRAKVDAAKPHFDFAGPGRPYARSPDDWRPFGGPETIEELIRSAGFKPSSMTLQLFGSPSQNLAARQSTELYVIDPMILMHRDKRDKVHNVQAGLVGGEAAFCIILPGSLPHDLRDDLAQVCERRLGDLASIWLNTDVREFEIGKASQLKKFLWRVRNQLRDRGNRANMVAWSKAAGVADPGDGRVPFPQLAGS